MTNQFTQPLSLGTIVSFNSPKEVSFQKLKDSLTIAGLDENLARELLPQNAFKRACRTLSKNRVIDVVKEDENYITFQFTKKEFLSDRVDFDYERDVLVDKKTGTVSTSNWQFQQEAQNLLDRELATRHGSDVTRLVHKVFDSHGGDLVKIRPQGGAYFVPKSHSYLVDNIRVLMEEIGGVLVSYEIGGDSETTKESIAQNMKDHFDQLITEFETSCELITENSSQEAKERRIQSFQALRIKAAAYKDLMRGFADEMDESFSKAEAQMNAKLFGDAFEGLDDDEDKEEENTGGYSEPVLEAAESPAHQSAQSLHDDYDLSGLFSGIL